MQRLRCFKSFWQLLRSSCERANSSRNYSHGPSSFGLLFDIDGVLVRGRTLIPGAKECFRNLVDRNGKYKVPVVFVTNAGNCMRQTKAEHLSHLLQVEVSPDQVMLSHSPLRMFTQFQKKCVLVSGQGAVEEVAHNLGFENVVTIDMLREAYPVLDFVDHNRRPKDFIPPSKGLRPIDGETLLHRACKRNQVETVLQILALPGTDINVKDHAGWTPLHEACNHGSTDCVRALLHHRPAPVLTDQVGGVSPLHDALLNGHLDIAKMLLEHAGSVLLQQTDGDGQASLDLVSALSQREELLRSAQVGDLAHMNKDKTEVLNLPLLEAGSSLLGHLIFSYQVDRGLPGLTQSGDKPRSLVYKLVRALETHSLQKVTLDWSDQRAVRLAEDVETLLKLSRGEHKEQVSLAVKECKGEKTVFLMETLENLLAMH